LRLDPDGSLHVLEEEIGCSNGIAWSPDLATMVYTDSTARTIWRYRYERATGALSDKQIFQVFEGEGTFDGLTIDAEGNVWTAIWGGSCVLGYRPDGALFGKVETGSRQTTCPTIEGDTMYITTAGQGDPDSPHPGGLFCLRGGPRGKPEFRSALRLPF
jgi:D-xylonolactonase